MSLRPSSSRPSIRLRRVSSNASTNTAISTDDGTQGANTAGRTPASNGFLDVPFHPARPRSRANTLTLSNLPDISEQTPGVSTPAAVSTPGTVIQDFAALARPQSGASRVSQDYLDQKPLPGLPPGQDQTLASRSGGTVPRQTAAAAGLGQREYDNDLVDYLDLIDPEVATLNTLNNVQNSLFIPDLGRFLNRRPTYNLTRIPMSTQHEAHTVPVNLADMPTFTSIGPQRPPGLERSPTLATIDSTVSESRYAVLPHGASLDGWSYEDKKELNDHVRHFMHSRRSKFKRSLVGFGQYVRKPLGFFVTLYATLITLFGLAWVLFLIGWINVGGRRYYIINVIDNVLVALFAVMGDGLAPFRIIDTYHMCFIAHYHHLTWKLRRRQSLPPLANHNDLPVLAAKDIEASRDDVANKWEYSVLSEKQQARLVHHQKKFSRSHTFYKPHETATHHAFPLRLLVAVVVLLDCHSMLQISLGACTWGINYHHRPFALTTVILCCSITVNITAGILITVGDHKTRKKDVLERMHRQDLTAEAMGRVAKRKEDEREQAMVEDRERKIAEEKEATRMSDVEKARGRAMIAAAGPSTGSYVPESY